MLKVVLKQCLLILEWWTFNGVPLPLRSICGVSLPHHYSPVFGWIILWWFAALMHTYECVYWSIFCGDTGSNVLSAAVFITTLPACGVTVIFFDLSAVIHALSLSFAALLESIAYCKNCYIHRFLIPRFWNIEILQHFNFLFSQCATGIYQAFDGQTELSRVLVLWFYPTRKIHENFMHMKITWFTVILWSDPVMITG